MEKKEEKGRWKEEELREGPKLKSPQRYVFERTAKDPTDSQFTYSSDPFRNPHADYREVGVRIGHVESRGKNPIIIPISL